MVAAVSLVETRRQLYVCGRAEWPVRDDGRPIPQAETWCRYLGEQAGSSVVVPMISCPRCNRIMFIFPDEEAVGVLVKRGVDRAKCRVSRVDRLGKVTPDVQCGGPGCHWSGAIYLDRWQDARPLWCVAYVEGKSKQIELSFCHAVSAQEAAFQLGEAGPSGRTIIASGHAVGFKITDEHTGAMEA